MKYFSRFIILIVILLVSWSSNSSVNLIFSKNTKFSNYVPASAKRSINLVKYNLVHSFVNKIDKDFSI